jgi:hypothetical protein
MVERLMPEWDVIDPKMHEISKWCVEMIEKYWTAMDGTAKLRKLNDK